MHGETVDMSKGTLTLLKIMYVIAIIGAVNWGLIGFFNWNLVDAIFGGGAQEATSAASRVIYALVGLSGIASLFLLPKTTDTTHSMPTQRSV